MRKQRPNAMVCDEIEPGDLEVEPLGPPKRRRLLRSIDLFTRVFPLARPRFIRGRVFQPKADQAKLLAELAHYTYECRAPFSGPVIVDITIYFKGTGTWPTAKKWGDEDNLRKAVNDALVASRVLKDDSLIIGGETWKLFGEEDRCEVRIWQPG